MIVKRKNMTENANANMKGGNVRIDQKIARTDQRSIYYYFPWIETLMMMQRWRMNAKWYV